MLVKEKIPTHNGLFQNTWNIVNGKNEIEENLPIKKSEKYVDFFVQKSVKKRICIFFLNKKVGKPTPKVHTKMFCWHQKSAHRILQNPGSG